MKKFITTLVLVLSTTFCFAQMRDQENSEMGGRSVNADTIRPAHGPNWVPRHRAFISPSGSWTPGYTPSFSLEAGTWGMSSFTSFSAVVDAVPVDRRLQYVVGPKAYWTAYNAEKLCYMFFVSPKYNTTTKEGLLEYGINPNYTLGYDYLLSVTLGQQFYENGSTSTFGSVGIIYLFHKK